MEEEIKEIEDTTVKCDNCGKVLYKKELCSCQKEEKPSWQEPKK